MTINTFYLLHHSATTDTDKVNLQFAWDVVKGKLLDSLSAVKSGIDGSVVQFEQNSAKRPSSLSAVAEGPRIRLLWRSFQWLNEEASTVNIYLLNFCLLHFIFLELKSSFLIILS